MSTHMLDRLVQIYENGGQYAIYDFARANHPEWAWEHCEPCEDETPTYDGVCAVCFTPRSPGKTQ